MADKNELKPIEFCLDELLKLLNKNWDAHGRLGLDGEKFMKDVGYPIRLEYFNEMIDILVKDGYATHKTDKPTDKDGFNKWYMDQTIITASGIFFILRGGYQQHLISLNSEKNRAKRIELAIAIGAVGLLILEIVKWTASRLDLVFCSCK